MNFARFRHSESKFTVQDVQVLRYVHPSFVLRYSIMVRTLFIRVVFQILLCSHFSASTRDCKSLARELDLERTDGSAFTSFEEELALFFADHNPNAIAVSKIEAHNILPKNISPTLKHTKSTPI